ncbi:MAG: hypothetical protein AAGE86_06950 [Pseudomonadota bacterium]
MRNIAVLLCALAISACAGGSGAAPTPNAPTAARPPAAAPPTNETFRPPQVMRQRGLDGVIGARASTLTSRFGAARIDLVEGDARKLQFAGNRCVLDIFLYPLEAGSEPVATHVDARLRTGGSEVDRASCIAEIEQR